MRETNIHHLLIEHRVIVFIVCAALLMIAVLFIGIKLMNYLDQRRQNNQQKKKEKEADIG